MLQWMAYVFVVTLVLSAAALSAERALRLRRTATRWTWATAIVASLLLPTLIASVSFQVPDITTPQASHKVIALRDATSLPLTILARIPAPSSSSRLSTETKLKLCWWVVSGVLVLLLTASAAQLFWRKRRWKHATVAGVSVYVVPNVGPAVVGLLRPSIVVPPWVTEAAPAIQAHVIAHEQSHLDAGDPRLLTLALCLLVFMPWNLPLWWQLRRLRRAIEVDCDARVLRAGHDATRYGETLLEVGARQSGFIGTVAAMSESPSFLEQRIKMMLRKPDGWWKMGAAVLTCVSVCLVAVAAQVSPPNSGATDDAWGHVAVSVDPAIYDRYVGSYKFGDTLVMKVTRDGNRLMTQMTGQPAVENFPSSETEFFIKVVNAQTTFVTDGQGPATALTLHQNGRDVTAPRISDQEAQQIESALNARVQSQTPTPGSEAAVRRLYNGLLAKKPNYDEMSPALADATHKQFDHLTEATQALGPIVSVEFRGVGVQGWDVYDVHSANGVSTWRISLSGDGKIQGALFQRGP
jgi:beta-lactamase regulating signal transducer with metallopeptidase domain